MSGALFSEYFLEDGVVLSSNWATIDDTTIATTRARLEPLLADFAARHAPNETNTESDLIEPVLELLGWQSLKREAAGRSDIPDYLLFLDDAAKHSAARATVDRYRLGAAILEAKRWERPLDVARGTEAAPSTQILRYLGRVSVESGDAIRFGLLTNGRLWRLYDQKARSRLEGYIEIDLVQALADDHQLRLFLYLFGRDAFEGDAGGRAGLECAISDSRSFEARVTDALADTVFETVFPELANALANADSDKPEPLTAAYRAELREAALTWLYRLLFVLYAEDRNLLPTRNRRDGLWATRQEVARAIDGGHGLSERRTNFDGDVRALWRQIDTGDEQIGLPPYNGGLFKSERSALLERAVMPDAEFAPLLDALSRERTGGAPRIINYRDLSVQHLGSVYERLLEYDLVVDEDGRIVARPQTFARKTSGSYYTPEELVMLVIRRAVGPLIEEKKQIFLDALADKERAKQESLYRLAWLGENFDPAGAVLNLRICDPAMGSGHFLVSLVDYLADQVMEATRWATEQVEDYRSPLLDRLEKIRARILAQAAEHRWKVEEAQLIDRQLVRRIILKRVIHGVDKNPMAVELAKLSLWLHTFTVGAPLSFLDHHLRCGDSLFGEWVMSGMERLERGGLYKRDELDTAERAICAMETVEELTDADIVEVHESSAHFEEGRAQIRPLERFFDLLQGYRWIEGSAENALKQAKVLEKASNRTNELEESLRLSREAWNMRRKGRALDILLEGELGPPEAVLDMCYGRIGGRNAAVENDDPALEPLVRAAEIAEVSNFLHWELAFPTVWSDWRSPSRRRGGFDAVIGNPPWDKMRFEEVQWFEPRVPEIARASTSAERQVLIEALRTKGDSLWNDYAYARSFSEQAMAAARRSPTLSALAGGDTNIYALFVAQAQQLLSKRGICGFLIPTEIATGLATSANFRQLTEQQRLHCILDFQNRLTGEKKQYFPDVYYREKFCVYVFGGSEQKWNAIDCAYFLQGTSDSDVAAQASEMTPAEFGVVNPNTGTAPVFRTKKDADLTRGLYREFPILVDRRRVHQPKQWPATYFRAFDMANDSNKFRTAEQLLGEKFYPVAGGRWKKGPEEWLPLYEGKIVQAFNHRAASIRREESNLHRVAQPVSAEPIQLADPNWTPITQFFVACSNELDQWAVAIKDVTSVTNARTVIAALIPSRAAGHTLPLIDLPDASQRVAFVAMLNSLPYDYLARQKVQKNHLAWFILEQLPVIPPIAYDRAFGALTAREIVAREVLHLSYTAHDMTAFARDMGHVDGAGEVLPPFQWDEEDRRQRRARLDALYFHLYGIGRADADYVLTTFPIVRSHDEAEFGRFVTRDLILAQMAALEAGDTEAVISLR
jgi:hypothetical protein